METRAAPTAESTCSRTDESRGEPRSWRVHPARQRPAQAILAGGIVLVVAGLVYVTMDSIGFAALSMVILAAALNRFFLPSRFAIDEDGITAAYPFKRMRYRWSEVQRFVWDEYGGYLSMRAAPSRLDAYRGMHLLFDEDRERIIAHIRARVGPAAGDRRTACEEERP